MEKTHQIIRYWKGQRLSVEVTEGELYEIQPEDPTNSGHLGRRCRVKGFDGEAMPRRAFVEYEDTQRIGLVRIGDLIEIIADGDGETRGAPAEIASS